MPKYFVLGRIFLRHKRAIGPRMVRTGDIIDFDGEPGAALVPIDEEAAQAKARVKRSPTYDHVKEGRLRHGLPSNLALQLQEYENALTASE